MSRVMKRVVQRATGWYIEPRWGAQREIDAELARFATDSVRAIDDLRQEIERLQTSVSIAHRRLHDLQRSEAAPENSDLTPFT